MSWFSALKPGDNITPPAQHLAPDAPLFGELAPEDLHWTCSTSIVTETLTFYATLPDRKVLMVQVIHSGVGLWQVQIQFTFGLYDVRDDGTAERLWKSVGVTNFACPAPPAKGVTYDRRSVKSDQFTIHVDPQRPDVYTIEGVYDADVAVSLEVARLPGVPGWKLGAGPRGGMTYFGALQPAKTGASPNEPDRAGGADGYCVHRFWPRCSFKGVVRTRGAVVDVDAATTRGVMIHAIQGMRPNLVASRWNFTDFQSSADDGVSLVVMEFTALHAYGDRKVTVGSVVVDDELVAVSAGPAVEHAQTTLDKETGYQLPRRIVDRWAGPRIGSPKGAADVTATLTLDFPERAGAKPGQWAANNLIEKVSVLAEVPTMVRKIIEMSGTNPWIYQFLAKDAEATISLPAADGKEAREVTVRGTAYVEASFLSEP